MMWLVWKEIGKKKKQMRRVKSENSKSLRSAWILFCTSVVSLKLYLCAYTLSALLHCQSCIFYSHLIHGRESDVASTLPRQAPTCVSTCCVSLQHASILFFLALSVIFRFIVSVPPTTVDLTQVKQTNLSSNKALFSPYHLALAVDDMQLFTMGSKSIHTLVVFDCLFYWISFYWIHISTMHLQKCDYCQRVFNGGLKRNCTLHDQGLCFWVFVNLQKKKISKPVVTLLLSVVKLPMWHLLLQHYRFMMPLFCNVSLF